MEPTRRQFVAAAATAAGCAYCVFGGGAAGAFAAPEVLTGPVKLGNKSEYAAEGVYDQHAKADQVILVNKGGRLYACSALCTHKTATLKSVDGQIRCPSHGSRYSADGTIVKGPAKRPLQRFAITADGGGELTVDRSKRFDEAKWNDEAASLKLR